MSGRKNTLVYQLASNQSLSSTFITDPTVIRYLDNCSYQIDITTTDSQGTFAVQGSNGFQENLGAISNTGTWPTLTLGGGVPSVNVANDIILISMNQLPFTAIRLVYTSTTPGTGTCNIYLSCKEIGG